MFVLKREMHKHVCQRLTGAVFLSFCFPSGAAGGGDSHHRAGDGQHGHIFRETATKWQNDQDRVANHFIQQVSGDSVCFFFFFWPAGQGSGFLLLFVLLTLQSSISLLLLFVGRNQSWQEGEGGARRWRSASPAGRRARGPTAWTTRGPWTHAATYR